MSILQTIDLKKYYGTEPDSKSMSGSVPLRRLLAFVDKAIVKPKCPRNVTAAKKFH